MAVYETNARVALENKDRECVWVLFYKDIVIFQRIQSMPEPIKTIIQSSDRMPKQMGIFQLSASLLYLHERNTWYAFESFSKKV